MEPQVLELPKNKATRLANPACAYCGAADELDNPLTDEHVVGRRFVPKGSLATGWSLIVRACERCNNCKADLEDDISAVTLMAAIEHEPNDPALAALASRKAMGSRSRRTKKAVVDSFERNEIKGKLMRHVDVSFGLIAPPQLDPDRVRRLAHMHLQGFFYLITYDIGRRTGGFIPGDIGWLNEASRRDWGNPVQRGFAALTRHWPIRVEGAGADGYFKIAIRRDPSDAEVWSFALEWNKSFRVVGFFGDLACAQLHVDGIPPLDWTPIDPLRRFRLELPLDPTDDVLFGPVGAETAASAH